ncbi:MAG: molybdopterin-dependent oxidoreductase [Actinomycetota bacterium]
MSQLVTLNIDDREISVPDGVTIIEAASRAGIEIPHLCYCKGLESTGACRLCLVELEGAKGLVVSCRRKVKSGMVVRTRTDRVLEARRFVVELILSNHPGDCMSCERNGTCELQKYAYELGIEKTRFMVKDPGYPVDSSNPLIERNYNLCILCGRCIRICKTQGSDILDFMQRGIVTKVTTPLDKPLQEVGCDFCGSCVAVCPVAALLERSRKFRGREWELNKTKTVCSYCGCSCDLLINTKNGEIVKVTTEEKTDYLCARGRFGWDYVQNGERLKVPLIKRDGKLVECTWDEALDYVARRLSKIKDTHGPHGLGGIVSAHHTNEVIYLFQKFMRACLGTNNVDSSVRLLSYPAVADFIEVFGTPDVACSLAEMEEADTLFIVHSDVDMSSPFVGVEIKRASKRGAKLVTIDPRSTRVAKISHLYLRPKPGTEAILLNGIAHCMLEEGLYNREFVETKCSNMDQFKEFLTKQARDVERKTRVSWESIAKAARFYGESDKKVIIIFSPEASDIQSIHAIINLLLLMGRVKGGVFPCMSLCNLRGAADVGALSEFYPSYKRVDDSTARRKFERIYGAALPDKPGLSSLEMIQSGTTILALYILGENPVVSFPNTMETVKALISLDFLVVQDIFLTETAKLADVVLPGISFAESSGKFTNSEGKVKVINRAIDPLARPDWKIIAELSSKMGYPLDYDSEEKIMDEIKTLIPAYSGGSWDWKERYSFMTADMGKSYETPDSTHPYLLMTGPTKFDFYDGSRTSRSRISQLEPFQGKYLGINPEDAKSLGITEGSKVLVSSKRGSITVVAKMDESLPLGLVFMPAHFPGSNTLTTSDIEPTTKTRKIQLSAVAILPLEEVGEVTNE